MNTALFIAAALQGFFGSAHCPVMCGPFVHILNCGANRKLYVNVLYNIGRLASYLTVGFLLGLGGHTFNNQIVHAAAIMGGFIVILFGFSQIFPDFFSNISFLRFTGRIPAKLSSLLAPDKNRHIASLMMGSLSGLLPCGLLYPVFALAFGSGNPLEGAGVLFFFWLGTAPTLFLMGYSSLIVWKRMNSPSLRLASGIFMVLFGLFLIFYRLNAPMECSHAH